MSAGRWVTQSYLAAHRAVVHGVVDAIVAAYRREKSDRAYAESEMAKYLGVTDKAALDFTYDFYVNEVMAAEPMPEAAQIAGDIDVRAASNPKVKTVNRNAGPKLCQKAEQQRP